MKNYLELKYFNRTIGNGRLIEVDMHYVEFEFELKNGIFENPYMKQLYNRLTRENRLPHVVSSYLQKGLYIRSSDRNLLVSDIGIRPKNKNEISITGGSAMRCDPFDFVEDYYLFDDSCHSFSQKYICEIIHDDIQFSSIVQIVNYEKAIYFQDYESAQKILETNDPMVQIEIGRNVTSMNLKEWECKLLRIMYDANIEKFDQNRDLKEQLALTENKTIVQCNSYDRIWGNGLLH